MAEEIKMNSEKKVNILDTCYLEAERIDFASITGRNYIILRGVFDQVNYGCSLGIKSYIKFRHMLNDDEITPKIFIEKFQYRGEIPSGEDPVDYEILEFALQVKEGKIREYNGLTPVILTLDQGLVSRGKIYGIEVSTGERFPFPGVHLSKDGKVYIEPRGDRLNVYDRKGKRKSPGKMGRYWLERGDSVWYKGYTYGFDGIRLYRKEKEKER